MYEYTTYIGERIRKLREAANETQDDLAKVLNVKKQIISYYESGKRMPNINHLALLSLHFGTTADYLLGLSDKPTSYVKLLKTCDFTGLSPESVNYFNKNKSAAKYRDYFEVDRIVNKEMHIAERTKGSVKYNLSYKKVQSAITDTFIAENYLDKIMKLITDRIFEKREIVSSFNDLVDKYNDEGSVDEKQIDKIKKDKEFTTYLIYRAQKLLADFADEVCEKEDRALENAEKNAKELGVFAG